MWSRRGRKGEGGRRSRGTLGGRGDPFITLTSGLDNLRELGRLALWRGAQDNRFERG